MTRLVAATVGAAAGRTLAAGGPVRVVAAFERSAYIASAGGLACVGGASLGAGPLAVRCAGAWPTRALAQEPGWMTGTTAGAGAGALVVGGLRIEWDRASPWRPPRLDARALRAGLAGSLGPIAGVLAAGATAPADEAGLAPLALERLTGRPARGGPLEDEARPPLDGLLAWLRDARGGPRAACALLGLGPGLTPSGDDLLGAMMVTLRAAGEPARADALARTLMPAAAARTSAISGAHLACAAAGAGTEVLHDLLVALHAGAPGAVTAAARDLARVGHSSGLDMLAGVGCVALSLDRAPGAGRATARLRSSSP